jgi:hypothetical protein
VPYQPDQFRPAMVLWLARVQPTYQAPRLLAGEVLREAASCALRRAAPLCGGLAPGPQGPRTLFDWYRDGGWTLNPHGRVFQNVAVRSLAKWTLGGLVRHDRSRPQPQWSMGVAEARPGTSWNGWNTAPSTNPAWKFGGRLPHGDPAIADRFPTSPPPRPWNDPRADSSVQVLLRSQTVQGSLFRATRWLEGIHSTSSGPSRRGLLGFVPGHPHHSKTLATRRNPLASLLSLHLVAPTGLASVRKSVWAARPLQSSYLKAGRSLPVECSDQSEVLPRFDAVGGLSATNAFDRRGPWPGGPIDGATEWRSRL